jgi:integrase
MPEEERREIRTPWNRGKLIGQKLPLTRQQIWSIRLRLELANQIRNLALLDLAIDSKLRGCDLVELKVSDISNDDGIAKRATVTQKKTQRPVQFEITQRTRETVGAWIREAGLGSSDYVFQSRIHASSHLSTRQYARIINQWVSSIGLDKAAYGTHSMRRTKATMIYRKTKNLRAVQLLLRHKKLDSTVRYLGIEMDDALELSERLDI